MLKVGFIDYLNTLPFSIDKIGEIEVLRDFPSSLNRLLFEDKIDVGIVSSAEYLEHYYKYFIFPDISISSKLQVRSVLILSKVPLQEIDTLYLTKESKSSVLLARVILEKFLGKVPNYRYFESPKNKESILVIGDTALRLKGSFPYSYDLSNLWYEKTNLPFTFALWCVNKESFLKSREEVLRFHRKLLENLRSFFQNPPSLPPEVLDYLKDLDYSLGSKHIESLSLFSRYLHQMGIIKSIPDFRFIDGTIITRDGTKTVYNFDYLEAYHSTKAGAYTESLEKFVKPSGVDKLLKEGKKVSVLDVGFGLGYNVATLINFSKSITLNPQLEIISIEKDQDFLERIKKIDYPDNLREERELILSLKEREIEIAGNTLKAYYTKKDGIEITVILQEGRKVLNILKEEGKNFDTVFYDPFSPKVNTEMWTLDLFRVIYQLMKDQATFLTYSNAVPVKVGLLQAGFKLGYVDPVGRRTPSLIATKGGQITPINESEILKIKQSKFATPYRDECFCLSSRDIWMRWEKEIEGSLSP